MFQSILINIWHKNGQKWINFFGKNSPLCKIFIEDSVVEVVDDVVVFDDVLSEPWPPLHTNLHWNPKRLGKFNCLFSEPNCCDLNIKAKGWVPPITMLTFSFFFKKIKDYQIFPTSLFSIQNSSRILLPSVFLTKFHPDKFKHTKERGLSVPFI